MNFVPFVKSSTILPGSMPDAPKASDEHKHDVNTTEEISKDVVINGACSEETVNINNEKGL